MFLYIDYKECINNRNFVIFVAMKQFRNTQYFITEDGKVFNQKGKQLSIKIRKEPKSSFERAYIALSIDKKQQHFTLSRIVAEVYIPNPNNLPQVNHKDGNPLNNHYSNLEWCSQSDNIKHAIKTGLKPMLKEDNSSSKLDNIKVKEIRDKYSKGNISLRDLAKNYNVSYTTIRYIVKNKTW